MPTTIVNPEALFAGAVADQLMAERACDMRATRVPAHRAEAEGTGR